MRVVLLPLLCLFLFAAGATRILAYDYSTTIECLAEPLKAQYKGGIISNPEFNSGLNLWSHYGDGKIDIRISERGNSFVVAHARTKPQDSFSQKLYVRKGNLYTFSAWIQVCEGKEPVTAALRTRKGSKYFGRVVAQSGCWTMLKGGLTMDYSGPAEVYFESKNTSVEIWVDSVSLQPFTKEQWRSHQDESVMKTRKRKVKIQAIDTQGKPLTGATISVKQSKPSFPFGSVMTEPILTNTAYQNWFASRFPVTTFGNEMKWYSHETSPGKENYTVSDAMLKFAQQHQIYVRGHNIFWDQEEMQPIWVKKLQTTDQLKAATEKRVNSVVSQYAGQVIAWDVVNENMHYSFFEDRLGKDFSARMFQKTHMLDPRATLFLNEYNTIEYSGDAKASPNAYLQKLKEIQASQDKSTQLAVGVQGHFQTPDIAYMRSALDTLATANLPIWITELDVPNSPKQAEYLEAILREAHSHPAIKGIVLWPGVYPDCARMCLTDGNFKNVPTGDVVDKMIHEWTQHSLVGTTDDNGLFETLLFHGDHDITITHLGTNSSLAESFKLSVAESIHETTLHFQIGGSKFTPFLLI